MKIFKERLSDCIHRPVWIEPLQSYLSNSLFSKNLFGTFEAFYWIVNRSERAGNEGRGKVNMDKQ